VVSQSARKWHQIVEMAKAPGSTGYFEGEQAFARFYAEEAEPLLVWFTRRTFDPDVALDLTGETFAKAFLGRMKLRGSDATAARAWLYGIARHELSRFWRKGRTESRAMRRLGMERQELAPSEQERLEQRAELDELRTVVAAALESVPPNQLEAIRLRVVDELPYPELADRLGVSEDAARARVSRGLRRLADLLDLQRATTDEELARA
jgi:RNA polymerase sigma factor (sigma-70 family)